MDQDRAAVVSHLADVNIWKKSQDENLLKFHPLSLSPRVNLRMKPGICQLLVAVAGPTSSRQQTL